MREGKRLKVYKDHKGIPTVGVGHRVVPADGLQVGDVITEERSMKFFNDDYKRLKLDIYCHEYPRLNANARLAIGSFIWCHGDGQYKTSRLRQYVGDPNITYDKLHAYLKANWDIRSKENQERNRRDFHVFFQDVLWSPAQGLTEKIVNKVAKPGSMLLLLAAAGIALFYNYNS